MGRSRLAWQAEVYSGLGAACPPKYYHIRTGLHGMYERQLVSECVALYSELSLRTPNALDALVSREQVLVE